MLVVCAQGEEEGEKSLLNFINYAKRNNDGVISVLSDIFRENILLNFECTGMGYMVLENCDME